MNNKEEYKKAIEQIKPSEDLKNETLNKIKLQKDSTFNYSKYLAFAAMFLIVFSFGMIYFPKDNNIETEENPNRIALVHQKDDSLPRFNSYEELEKVLKDNYSNMVIRNTMRGIDALAEVEEKTAVQDSQNVTNDFSRTNVQVENVDEADTIKTDGKFIYYVRQGKVYIIEAKEMKLLSEIEVGTEKEGFTSREIYIYKNKLVILGTYYGYEETKTQNMVEDVLVDVAYVATKNMAAAIVYDITDRERPVEVRKVKLSGYYSNSRMIGENLYFIANKPISYYEGIKNDEVLPIVEDKTSRVINAENIIYFKDSNSMQYMIVAGLNINNQEEANIETFMGASGIVYASENNLYIIEPYYGREQTTIYKFELKNSRIKLNCKGEFEGDIKNQFSLDEYDGNLRIAVTYYDNGNTLNKLYVFDENLEEISRIDDMAKGETIYSVRFMGKIGYIVTFKQIDPLFVVDLSDPRNPKIMGELKIPGYSSYLHPYDETHVIGIGYNTKENEWGGISNTSLKMSMFDVSDLTNPKEIFNVSIGNKYAYSEVMYEHKKLFYSKEKNLIGFPITLREDNYKKDRNGFIIYHIDLEKGFEEYAKILQEINYKTNIQRVIYIGNTLYTFAEGEIKSYVLNTMEEIGKFEF